MDRTKNFSVDDKVGENSRLLTTKYNNTASSSSGVQDPNSVVDGRFNSASTDDGVMVDNPVVDISHAPSVDDDDSDDSDSDDDLLIEWTTGVVDTSSSKQIKPTIIYGPKLPTPHVFFHHKVDSLIVRLRTDPKVPIHHVPSKRKRSAYKQSTGVGAVRKKLKPKLGQSKAKGPLYSQSTPLVRSPSSQTIVS